MTEPDSKPSETPTEASVESQGGEPSATAERPAQEPDAAAPEPTPSEAGGADAPADASVDAGAAPDADTVSGAEAQAEASADTVSGESAPAGKKKRRRRRKKKGAGASEAPGDPKASQHHAPFLHLFAGAARKHAFSVGEVIAGRVERVEHGTIVVDLFGKASAISDVDEPRDVPIITHESGEASTPATPSVSERADDGLGSAEGSAPDATESSEPAGAPVEATDASASGGTPTPVVRAPTPEVAKVVEGDASSWEYSETEVTDLPDDDLAEADTVVAAQAYDPTLAPAAPEDQTAPAAAAFVAETETATVAETAAAAETEAAAAAETEAAAETATVAGTAAAAESAAVAETAAAVAAESVPAAALDSPEMDPGAVMETASGVEAVTEPPEAENLDDADLTLLEPLAAQEPPQLGAIFRGRIGAVAESGHIAIVNRVVDKSAVRKAIRAARAKHLRVQGIVYGFNRGGFDVLVGGVRAFCPASAMSLTPVDDPNTFVGQRCEFSLPQDKGGKKSIIVSRRNILEKEARKRARDRMAELQVGEKIHGKVLEVRDYGVLVDLGGGLDGLVHMSEVSWSRGVRPQDAAKVGDEVDVEVLKVQQATRKDRYGRVSLSMRKCLPDPWESAKDTLRPGTPVKGKIVRTTDFGAFVEISESVEGLLHISELGGSKELTHAKQAVSEGDEIHVVIERVDQEQRRISLSKLSEADAKAIEAGEIEVGKAPRSLKPGSHVAVVVKRVEHGGAQVQVDGMLGKRGRGFIPNRELQDLRGEKRKGPSQGDVIEVKVVGTERDGTLRCSVRARLLDEERKAVREYRKESAKQGLGTFGDLLKAKLGGDSE